MDGLIQQQFVTEAAGAIDLKLGGKLSQAWVMGVAGGVAHVSWLRYARFRCSTTAR